MVCWPASGQRSNGNPSVPILGRERASQQKARASRHRACRVCPSRSNLLPNPYIKAGPTALWGLPLCMHQRRKSSSLSWLKSGVAGRGGTRFNGSYRKAVQDPAGETTPFRWQRMVSSVICFPRRLLVQLGSMFLLNSMDVPPVSLTFASIIAVFPCLFHSFLGEAQKGHPC